MTIAVLAIGPAQGVGQTLPRSYVDVYAGPLYSARFSDAIAFAQAQLHRRLGRTSPVTAFLGAALTKDSRSRGGNLPAVFADNFATIGIGLGAQPGPGYVVFRAEANVAVNLVRTADHPRRSEPDYRVLGATFRRWERAGHRRFAELYGSAGYYSRYRDNGIAYVQVRGGWRLSATRPFYAYARLNLVKDTNRDFFNNLAEGGPGLEWRPGGPLNVSARAEVLGGVYFGISGRDQNPYGPSYSDFRVLLVLGRRWLVGGAGGRP